MDTPDTLIDLIRHGEPEGGKKYRGQTDDPLTERGWQQMWTAVGGHRPWRRIVSSPLSRCAAFAHALAGEMGLEAATDPRLMEVGYGPWSGRTTDEIRAEEPDAMAAFLRDPWSNRPVGAEDMERFTARVLAAYEEHRSGDDGPLLIVAHAGVLRTVIAHNLGMPLENLFHLQIPYAGRARFHAPDGRLRLTHLAARPPER
ncbi:histidine phosphatase family protein [Thiohalorhabdus methylotrophus]|uniref:Histidine phosphatase family protein n=1 Tax=Thiohalorhabdus methylotrophus TaxID=3242694 RepID=A0ABV4TZ77_9GAMM